MISTGSILTASTPKMTTSTDKWFVVHCQHWGSYPSDQAKMSCPYDEWSDGHDSAYMVISTWPMCHMDMTLKFARNAHFTGHISMTYWSCGSDLQVCMKCCKQRVKAGHHDLHEWTGGRRGRLKRQRRGRRRSLKRERNIRRNMAEGQPVLH